MPRKRCDDSDRPERVGVTGRLRKRMFGHDLSAKWCLLTRLLIASPLVVVLLLGLAYLFVPRFVLLPLLGNKFGLEVDARRVELFNTNFDLVLEGVRVRVPGIEGNASTIARVERIEASYDLGALLSGKLPVERVVLWAPTVRISQDSETGRLNIADVVTPAGGGGMLALPEISIVGVDGKPDESRSLAGSAVEVGEHSNGSFTLLWRIGIDGRLRPADTPGEFAVDLVGVTDVASDSIVTIQGTIGPSGTNLTISDVDLSIDPTKVPTRIRGAFSRFELSGKIPTLTFQHVPGGEQAVRLELDGVEMSLPFGAGSKSIRLFGTRGELASVDGRFSGNLFGSAEDVPYAIEFETGAVAAGEIRDIPFELTATVTDYALPPEPPVVPFLPETVQVRLDQFSNPTGIVDARIELQRSEMGGKVHYSGVVDMREGRAAYRSFPYEFGDMTAHVEFDSEAVRLTEVTGTAPGGATLYATGIFAPPSGIASVDLNIRVHDVPINDRLREALNDDRRRVVDELISTSAYEDLVERGMIDEGFDLGGTASIDISLVRELGEISVWHRRYDVSLDGVGLLPERFRMPIVARDVLVSLSEDDLQVVRGQFDSPTGASGEIRGSALFEDEQGNGVFRPDLMIDAFDVLVDPWMPIALEGVAEGKASEVITSLGLRGKTSGSVGLVTRDDTSFGFDIIASLEDVSSLTDGLEGVPPLTLEPNNGSVRVREGGLDFEFDSSADSPVTSAHAFHAIGSVDWSEPGETGFEQKITSELMDARLPVEQMVAVFSSDISDRISEVRADLAPSARARVEFHMAPGEIDTTLDRLESLSFVHAGGRVELGDPGGLVRVRNLAEDEDPSGVFVAELDGVHARVSFEGDPAGEARLDGVLPIGGAGTGELSVEWVGGRWESRLLHSIVREDVGGILSEWYQEFEPSGAFDVTATLSRPTLAIEPRGTLELGPFELSRGERRVGFDAVSGQIVFQPGSIAFDAISAESAGEQFWAGLDGVVRFPASGPTRFDSKFRVEAPALSPGLRSLLPKAARDLAKTLALEIDGPLSVPGARLGVVADEQGPGIELDAQLVFEQTEARAGVTIEDAAGSASLALDIAPGGAPAFTSDIVIDNARVAKVVMTDGSVRVTGQDDEPGVVRVREASAAAHGGRVAGEATILTSPEEGVSYAADVRFSELALSGVLWDLSENKEDKAPSPTDALLNGRVTLGGARPADSDKQESMRGRGELIVSGGRVLDIPLTLAVLQAGHFQLPTGSAIDLAHAGFYVEDGLVTFDTLSLESGSVDLYGYGTMTWPGRELDLRFISRSASRIPLLSALAEGVRDELVTTTVRGRVGEHTVGTEQFAVTRRLLEGVFDADPDPRRARLDKISERAGDRGRLGRRLNYDVGPLWPTPTRPQPTTKTNDDIALNEKDTQP